MTIFPDPAARSADEAALFRAVLADLTNDLPRLAYADWLDDRDDPRGSVLRASLQSVRSGGRLPKATRPKPWLALTGVHLLTELHRWGLGDRANTLLKLARPVITLKAKRASEKSVPVGASKFNGDPDLPADLDWPEGDGSPLPFLAQINLAEVHGSPAAADLPAGGWLSVFYDDEAFETTDSCWRLVHTPADAILARRLAPKGLKKGPTCRLTCVEALSLPSAWDSPFTSAMKYDDWSESQQESFGDHADELQNGHHLLGYPLPVQNDTLGSKTRRHLLTLDSDDAADWCFGDVGALYFNVSAAELARGKLGRPRFEMQCC